jgi:hypothetical protein
MDPAIVVAVVVMMGGFAILYRERAKTRALLATVLAKLPCTRMAQIIWKKSPYREDRGSPLQWGSMYGEATAPQVSMPETKVQSI